MTIQLKLDTAATLSLFPENSEARIELQQAVIANVVNSLPPIASMHDYVVTQIINKQFTDILNNEVANSWNGPSQKVKEAVKTVLEGSIHNLIVNVANDHLNEMRSNIEINIKSEIDLRLQNHIKYAIDRIDEYIEKRVSNIISNIIEDVFNRTPRISPTANKVESGG